MSGLPDELWREILEIGIRNSKLSYKDLCCISISCRRLRRLSGEDFVWSHLLSSDFPLPPPQHHQSSSSSTTTAIATNHRPSAKSAYKIRFEKERARKIAAHRRAVFRKESEILEHERKLNEIEARLREETEKMRATATELSNLHKVRQASVALNVWQPEVVRGRQKQIVEQCVVPVESRVRLLAMELKLCRQQIVSFNKAHGDEKRRVEMAKEELASMKYHPLRDYRLTNSEVGECKKKRKKLKTCVDFPGKQGKTS